MNTFFKQKYVPNIASLTLCVHMCLCVEYMPRIYSMWKKPTCGTMSMYLCMSVWVPVCMH